MRSTPIDLIKASLLRGIWHLNELNLQFAGTCFALTTRLAHAAVCIGPRALVRMRIEEAQARRNLWWNIVFYEVAHAHRIGQPPCLTHEGRHPYPDDYDALYAMYERAGLADPTRAASSCHPRYRLGASRAEPANFDYPLVAIPHLPHLPATEPAALPLWHLVASDPNLNDEYAKWRENLPDKLKQHFERRSKGSVRPSDELLAQVAAQSFDKGVYDPKITEELQDYQQAYSLEFIYNQCMITLHRPYIDEQVRGSRPSRCRSRSRCVCSRPRR